MMFKIQDVDLLEKVKEGLSNGLWGTIEESDPDTGTQAIAHLITVVVHRPHGVVAAKIAEERRARGLFRCIGPLLASYQPALQGTSARFQ